MTRELVIDPEFAALIPPLMAEERAQLEYNLLQEGCRDPLVVWNNVLLDGHNRYAICTRHNLPFQVVEKRFNTRQAAITWIIYNQLGRRNLNSYQRSLLALRLKTTVAAPAKERMLAGKRTDPPQNVAEGETNTLLGSIAQVSRETIRRVEFIEARASETLKEQARRGDISIHHAFEQVQTDAKLERGAQAQQILHANESNEWYTPALYIRAVHELMGGIDLDPASSHQANQVVQAKHILTIEENGLMQLWPGRVFLNPPYGFEGQDSNQALWSQRLVEQYEAGITTEAVLLVNATPERKWFQPLWNYLICFTDHRIHFYRPGGEAHQPTHGNVFVYLGEQTERFKAIFGAFGVIAKRV